MSRETLGNEQRSRHSRNSPLMLRHSPYVRVGATRATRTSGTVEATHEQWANIVRSLPIVSISSNTDAGN